MEYWLIPFGVLQTCCKIQKCKKIIFVVFKKSMRKHIFKTSNIFLYKKKHSKHVRVLVVCMKIYIYICHIASKTRHSKYQIGIYFSYNIKNPDIKINMPENKSLSLSFFFYKKSKSGRASDPAGHKRAQLKFQESWRVLFK